LHYALIDRDKEAEDRFEEVIPRAIEFRNQLLAEFRRIEPPLPVNSAARFEQGTIFSEV
jgi:hypothetical protein